MLFVMLVGVMIDFFLMYCSVFYFMEDVYVFIVLLMWIVFLWLVLLWGVFVVILVYSLDILCLKFFLVVLVGGIFVFLSYLVGVNFGVVDFGYFLMIIYIILCVVWGFILFWCFLFLDKFSVLFELELVKRR